MKDFNILKIIKMILNQDQQTLVTNEKGNTYQVNADTAKAGFKSGKYTKPTKSETQKFNSDKKNTSNSNSSISYQKSSSDQDFSNNFKKLFNIKETKSLYDIVDKDTASNIESLTKNDENLKQQVDAMLRYLSLEQKHLKQATKFTSKDFINSKLTGAGPLESTMGELMVLINTKLPDQISKKFYQQIQSNLSKYPTINPKRKETASNMGWWKSGYQTSKNIKNFLRKNNIKVKTCCWDNNQYIKDKYGEETYNSIYKGGTTADMFVQTEDNKVIPVSLKKGSAVRLGTMSPGKVTRKMIPPYEVGGSKYIATQRENLWEQYFKKNDITKHFSKVADIFQNMSQEEVTQAEKYKKDFYSILKVLKKQNKLDLLRNIKSLQDVRKLTKSLPEFKKKGARASNKLLMNSVDIQKDNPDCNKMMNEIIDVGKKSANRMTQVLFNTKEGKKVIMNELLNILPFSQFYQKNLLIADPQALISKKTFQNMGIPQLDDLGKKINLEEDQKGNVFITIQIFNKIDNASKHVKVAKLIPIQSGAGYANNIVMTIQQHKDFHNTMIESNK